MRASIILLLISFISTLGMAFEWDQIGEIYKKVEKARKEAEGNQDPAYQTFYIESAKREDIGRNAICVDCLRLEPLAKEVNKIVQRLAQQEHEKNPNTDLLEEVGQLEGMYYYVMEEAKHQDAGVSAETRCYKFMLGNILDWHNDFDVEESKLVFTQKFDISKVQSLQLRDPRAKKKSYFYRGRGIDRDVVVRVDLEADGSSKIRYYRVGRVRKRSVGNDRKDLLLLGSGGRKDSLSRKNWGFWEEYRMGDSEQKNEDGELAIDYGLRVRRKGFIPKDVTVLDARGGTQITTGMNLQGRVQIGSEKLGARMAMTDEKGNEYVNVRAGLDGLEVGIPLQFNVYQTELDINGEVIVGEETRGQFSLVYDGRKVGNTTIEHKGGDDIAIGIGHESSFAPGHSISLGYRNDDVLKGTSSHGGWVRYRLSF